MLQPVNKIVFPQFQGLKCNMMPFIQGDSSSLPEMYKSYSDIVDSNFLEKGEVGYLSIQESFVKGNSSQRGYNGSGISRNVHIEVGRKNGNNRWGGGGGNTWGGRAQVSLADSTKVLIANSIDDTCRVWDVMEKCDTPDGDLSHVIDRYPEETGLLLKSGDLYRISIFTPHECINQKVDGNRQFFRIVGSGVTGREEYFTKNPLLN